MTNDFLKYCRYYKGEENPPYDKDYMKFTVFWFLERQYFTGTEYTDKHDYWESDGVDKMCAEPKILHDFLTQKKWDKTTRGFLAYAVIMSLYNNPARGFNFIQNYGK